MADVAGSVIIGASFHSSPRGGYEATLWDLGIKLPPPVFFKMRAQDDGVSLPGYVTWVASEEPDFEGSAFSEGSPTPVGSMIVDSAVITDTWGE